ncbi:SAM-dependent methyltransferase [Actinoplanes oblitus]|uniref:SAM-dependent methyltransferase n=1 Tax=Actinoplanes oblitus TaxID=3040509 RepID=A0ABY8W7E0_9ACTN|nr:SAM-dependent methyltransferase [Actinoplanes oblitus]WIM93061.1 SAM-dependent methyltransferase [Actinoplanes oblitus]
MPEDADIGRLNTSRRYNQWLGGKDHYAAERESTATIVSTLPNVVVAAREGRAVLLRAVRHLVADLGIRQILDIGAGQPHAPNVHEVAQEHDPSCRIVYVDSDPLVGVHHRGTIVSSPQGAAEFVDGDLLDIEKVLVSAGAVVDFERPVGVLLSSVLHLIDDDERARAAVRTLIGALAPGSYVFIVHGTFDTLTPEVAAKAQELIDTGRHGVYRARSRAEVARFAEGLELVEPGLVSSVEWRPGPDTVTSVTDAMCWTVLGRVS